MTENANQNIVSKLWRHPALLTAAIAGAYILLVTASMIAVSAASWPVDHPEFVELQAQLLEDPQNSELKESIRAYDLALRNRYFRTERFIDMGRYMLIAGVLVMLLALRWYASDTISKLPHPSQKAPDETWDIHAVNRRSLAATAAVVMFAVFVLAATATTNLPWAAPAPDAAATETPSVASVPPAVAVPPLDASAQWPKFRGPDGMGIAHSTSAPRTWDVETGENILWKTEIRLPGQNSPVVWGDRVFLTGADRDVREVYCFDADSGELLWTRRVDSGLGDEPTVMEGETGYAAPTATTDGERVFAIFANGDLAAFTLTGEPAWSMSLGTPENMYGHASSLIVHDGLLIIQYDQGYSADEELSMLIALHSDTGRMAWQIERPVSATWSTPVIIESDRGPQMITTAAPFVISYDPANGAELWRVSVLAGDIASSAVYSNGMVFVASPSACVAAIRIDGEGDVTETHIEWMGYDGLPDTTSPLVTDTIVLLVNSYGVVTGYDALTGDLLWEHDFFTEFYASPTLIGDLVYLPTRKGNVEIFKAGREFEHVDSVALGEQCDTSPAFVGERIYFRAARHLFCIGSNDGGR